jgi:(p)ppGpp synthase/HD superfamily hydrolase
MNSDKGLDLIALARHIALRAHQGQFRRDGKTPYFNHVHGVATSVEPNTPENVAAGYLHDVIEDTNITAENLKKMGIPESVVQAVVLLTKTEGGDYMEYLNGVKNNPIARAVKIAYMNYNLSETPTEKQKEKYAKGLAFLK